MRRVQVSAATGSAAYTVDASLLNDELAALLGANGGARWHAFHSATEAIVELYDDAIDETAVRSLIATHVARDAAARVAARKDLDAKQSVTAMDKLQNAVLFDLENRVRVLEGKPAVTAQQYRSALITKLRSML